MPVGRSLLLRRRQAASPPRTRASPPRTRPAELGFLFHSRQWEPPSALVSVEAYVYLQSTKRIVGNIGTYESTVLRVANASQLQALHWSRPRRPRPNVSSYPLFPASQLISSACSIMFGMMGTLTTNCNSSWARSHTHVCSVHYRLLY